MMIMQDQFLDEQEDEETEGQEENPSFEETGVDETPKITLESPTEIDRLKKSLSASTGINEADLEKKFPWMFLVVKLKLKNPDYFFKFWYSGKSYQKARFWDFDSSRPENGIAPRSPDKVEVFERVRARDGFRFNLVQTIDTRRQTVDPSVDETIFMMGMI